MDWHLFDRVARRVEAAGVTGSQWRLRFCPERSAFVASVGETEVAWASSRFVAGDHVGWTVAYPTRRAGKPVSRELAAALLAAAVAARVGKRGFRAGAVKPDPGA